MAEEHKEGHEEGHGGSHGGGGHGGGHAEGEHEGAPEWLISFADMVMLIMGFFVILLAMNMGPKGASAASASAEDQNDMAADIVLSIRDGFNSGIDLSSSDPREAWLRKRVREKGSGGQGDQEGPTGNKPNLHAPRPTEYHGLGGTVDFDDGSDIVTFAARTTAIEIAEKLKGRKWIVEVRGHTSPSETLKVQGSDATSRVERGLELSYRRGRAVARVLVEQGIKWENIRVSAAGDHERVVARTYDSKQDRKNQRVDIIVTNDLKKGDPYAGSAMEEGQ